MVKVTYLPVLHVYHPLVSKPLPSFSVLPGTFLGLSPAAEGRSPNCSG